MPSFSSDTILKVEDPQAYRIKKRKESLGGSLYNRERKIYYH